MARPPKRSRVLEDLSRRKLLRPKVAAPGDSLLALCEAGALAGGLSIALDVKPDEAFGPLCAAVGGQASKLRVLDVRKEPFELVLRLGDLEECWDVPNVGALVHNLNDLLRDDFTARAVAVLGEWEDALQLWCIPKAALVGLFATDYFMPENAGDLQPLSDRA